MLTQGSEKVDASKKNPNHSLTHQFLKRTLSMILKNHQNQKLANKGKTLKGMRKTNKMGLATKCSPLNLIYDFNTVLTLKIISFVDDSLE